MTGRRLRVGLVHPFVWPEVRRGGERYLDDLAGWLGSAGHEVEIIAYGETTHTERLGSLVLHRRRRQGRRVAQRTAVSEVDLFGVVSLPALLRYRYDVVHALVPAAAVAAHLCGQRVVYTVLGAPTPDQFGVRPGDRRVFTTAVRLATVATALSTNAMLGVEEMTGRRPVVLAPGVVLDHFPLLDEPRTPPPRFLYSSDLSVQRKGLDVLLAAMPMVLERHPDARLVLAGPGKPDWAFNRLDVQLTTAVRNAVDIAGLGTPEELVRLYQEATVTILPAKDEAFGLVMVESLACGTPVVGCTGSGMDDIVTDRSIGRLVAYGDAGALADALVATVDVSRSPATPARCRVAASRFDWAGQVGPAHEAVYRRACRR
jgi:phosphatidylinositol alpha-mannosyltransferase